jgi:hypothetical protein
MNNASTLEEKHAQIFERVKSKANNVDVRLIVMFSEELKPHQIYQNSIWYISEKQFLKELLFFGNDIDLCLDFIEKVLKEKYTYWRMEHGEIKQKFSDKPINPFDLKFEEARLMTATHWKLYFQRNKEIYNKAQMQLDFNEKLL